jgi:hypothetical protein
MENKQIQYNGIGFCGLLTIVFITLKLLKVITWPWAWVLSPIWIPVVIIAVIGPVSIIVIITMTIQKGRKNKT